MTPAQRPSTEDQARDRRAEPALRSTLSREQAEATAAMLRVVSDPTRLQMLSIMHTSPAGEVGVSELAGALGLRSPTVSHHVRLLAEAGVVRREQRGRNVWCSIVPARLEAIADLLR